MVAFREVDGCVELFGCGVQIVSQQVNPAQHRESERLAPQRFRRCGP